MTVLSVSNVGKSFREYGSEWRRFANWFGLPLAAKEEHWVMRNISFDMVAGEALGIVGQNGAGKSTLLKMITGTLAPTTGSVGVNGRISAILELGMGFSADLTGRENARHAAGLMGFSAEAIETAMSSLEAFAEIGEHFDQPTRTYSSGMQMRVAFAVATAWRPEILIIDEALSVGDSYFQHKCFSRIRQFQEAGTTLLFVSHDGGAVQTLCDRAILLEGGKMIKDGNPEEVLDFYNALIAEKENSTISVKALGDGRVQTTSGTGEATVESISLINLDGNPVEYVGVGDMVELVITVRVNEAVDALVLGYGIKDRLGKVMYGTNTAHTNQVLSDVKVGDSFQYTIAFPANFGVGSYSIQTALCNSETHLTGNYEWVDLALVFNIVNINKAQFAGCMWNESRIDVQRIAV